MNTISRMGVGRQICKTAASIFLAVSVVATAAVAGDAKKFKIIFVSPLGPGNQFMLPMIKGFQDAGRQLGLDVTFRGNQETNDFAAAPVVKRLLEDAIATKPDAIVVSDQFPDVLNGDIKQAVMMASRSC